MTEVVVLKAKVEKPKRKIEFCYHLEKDMSFTKVGTSKPQEFQVIELIKKDFTIDYDLLFCCNEERENAHLFLGRFNDGVV